MINYVKTLFVDFFSTVYPTNCVNCADILVTNEKHLCTSCLLSLPKTDYHLNPKNTLFTTLSHNPLMINAFCYLHYSQGGIAQNLLHQIKYQNKPELGMYLGELYGKEILRSNAIQVDFDMVLAVPMHDLKRNKRGYNQSEYIADGLSKAFNIIAVFDAVIKTVNTESQTKRSKLQRWQNVKNRFHVEMPAVIYNKNVLLVDDVITTGATISELCDELTKCGVASITVCSLASGIK